MKEKISVIIPAYNSASTIIDTLGSVINQKISNIEIIVVDDGSIDNTAEIVIDLKEKDSRIKYIYQNNSGVSSARNNGISNSIGKYVTFLDSDDFFDENFLYKLYKKAEEESFDIVFSGYRELKNDKMYNKKSSFSDKNPLFDYIVGNNQIHTSSWLISRKYLTDKNIFFNKDYNWGEDFDFFFRVLLNSKKIGVVSEYLTIYNNDNLDSRLSSFTFDKIEKDVKVITNLAKIAEDNRDYYIKDILLKYRLPALIIYRLLEGYEMGASVELIEREYNKYEKFLNALSKKAGLRSIKLAVSKYRLKKIIKG